MQVKTIMPFRDRENGLEIRQAGEVFECTDERAAILGAKGLITKISTPETEKAVETPENAENGTTETPKPKRRRKKTE